MHACSLLMACARLMRICIAFFSFLGAMHQYALRVLATATCLAGWPLAGWLAGLLAVRHRAGIVSKRLNLS